MTAIHRFKPPPPVELTDMQMKRHKTIEHSHAVDYLLAAVDDISKPTSDTVGNWQKLSSSYQTTYPHAWIP